LLNNVKCETKQQQQQQQQQCYVSLKTLFCAEQFPNPSWIQISN